jgi:hypothetical protein
MWHYRFAIFEASGGAKGMNVQVRLFVRGAETVLGDAASDDELFATDVLQTRYSHPPQRPACISAHVEP